MAIAAKLGWKVFAGVTGVVTSKMTTKALNEAWETVRGEKAPINMEQKGVAWQEAVVWTIAQTAGLAVARLLSTRVAANAWEKATGAVPPGLEVPPAPTKK